MAFRSPQIRTRQAPGAFILLRNMRFFGVDGPEEKRSCTHAGARASRVGAGGTRAGVACGRARLKVVGRGRRIRLPEALWVPLRCHQDL